jgi:hypothetical protein
VSPTLSANDAASCDLVKGFAIDVVLESLVRLKPPAAFYGANTAACKGKFTKTPDFLRDFHFAP